MIHTSIVDAENYKPHTQFEVFAMEFPFVHWCLLFALQMLRFLTAVLGAAFEPYVGFDFGLETAFSA